MECVDVMNLFCALVFSLCVACGSSGQTSLLSDADTGCPPGVSCYSVRVEQYGPPFLYTDVDAGVDAADAADAQR
jgi:hypothetical protein